MKFWFTSDMHLDHANIIVYTNRPFNNIDHMNSELVRRWNERVKPEDTVFHIGDFCFKGGQEGGTTRAHEWERKLNGKIIFIRGNHDRNNSCKAIIEGLLIKTHGRNFYLVHNPEHHNRKIKINLVGHVHEKWLVKNVGGVKLINCGVDVHNFYPQTIDELLRSAKR